MSHLMETMQRMADKDPQILRIRKIPVGTIVLYSGRSGAMRQGRVQFPAVVLHQHPDDGSLDLIVMFEAEDIIWEQRVGQKSETQPAHCWEIIPRIDVDDPDEEEDHVRGLIRELRSDTQDLKRQMYGEYEAPPKSMIEYLDDFDQRLKKLEKQSRK